MYFIHDDERDFRSSSSCLAGTNMDLIEKRDSLFVPSMKSQSLLGKAVFEHFTEPEQVASVFSSSPFLQNSSAGANFMTNFRINSKSIELVETVFTPEDCFAVQFSPCLEVFAEGSDDWEHIFSMISNLINKTRYAEASLRSLKITSACINDEQLQFILSNSKRIKQLSLDLGHNHVSSDGISNSIGENLSQLEDLRIFNARSLNTSVLKIFAAKLTKLTTFAVDVSPLLNLVND
jgi:hypothetical protein